MAAGVGLAMNPPHVTEERAVFTQLKPVRMSAADGAEDAAVFEDVKPGVRISANALTPAGLQVSCRAPHPRGAQPLFYFDSFHNYLVQVGTHQSELKYLRNYLKAG